MKPTEIATELVNDIALCNSEIFLGTAIAQAKAFAQAWSQEVEFLSSMIKLGAETECAFAYSLQSMVVKRSEELKSALQILKDGGIQ